jgi:hypothetical protein
LPPAILPAPQPPVTPSNTAPAPQPPTSPIAAPGNLRVVPAESNSAPPGNP